VELNLALPWAKGTLTDLFETERAFQIQDGHLEITVSPNWGRVLVFSE
jgi:hypothetical protein